MPTVWNKRDPHTPPTAIYVGRPSKWGNPHIIGRCPCGEVHDRKEAIAAFRRDIPPELKAAAKRELRGRDLVCWCAPKDCHADVWVEIANG